MSQKLKLLAVICVVVLPLRCAGFGDIKKIGPVVPGQSTWMITGKMGTLSDEITATPIFNSDQVAGVITISQSGNYQLAENIVFPLIISASQVSFDLKGYTILVGSGLVGITVNPSLVQVTIRNGYLKNSAVGTGIGVFVAANASMISLQDLNIIGFGSGVSCTTVMECNFDGLRLISNTVGMLLADSDACVVKNCNSLYSAQCGFQLTNPSLLHNQSNCFFDCNALKTQGAGSVAGFQSAQGTSNMFKRCTTKQTKTSSDIFGDTACGFLLTGTEFKTKIVDCVVNETDVLNSSTVAVTYGINLAPLLLSGTDLLSQLTTLGTSIPTTGVAWSPNDSYLAVSEGTQVAVFGFNGRIFSLITAVNTTDRPNRIAWSPDGKYLAVTLGRANATNTNLRVYTFDGTVLSSPATIQTPYSAFGLGWSSNGKYIAIGDSGATNGNATICTYSFDGTTITAINATSPLVGSTANLVVRLAWAPDGSAIFASADGSNNFYILPVSPSGQVATSGASAVGSISDISVSPNGKYIALCVSGVLIMGILVNGNLVIIASTPADVIQVVQWSPDGNYLACGLSNGTVKLFSFQGNAFALLKTVTVSGSTIDAQLAWSADGRYLTTASSSAVLSHTLRAMYGPLNCLVDSCIVCDILAANTNGGRGLVSGGANVFLNNKACENGVNYSYGIPNVYDGRFELFSGRATAQPFDNISVPIFSSFMLSGMAMA